jgi:hypothetical protein
MVATMRLEGAKDLERALADLPRGTATGVARRAMRKELEPVAATANAFWPGSSDDVFRVTSRIVGSQMGDSEMVRGPSILNLFVGAPGGKGGTPHAHLLEFGTGPRYTKNGAFRGSVSPTPMLQPAWDMHKGSLLPSLGQRLWDEIQKTVARRAARAAR